MFCHLPYYVRSSSTAASRLAPRLSAGGRGQKLLPAMVAAKVERLSIAFSVESGCFVHGHSADGVFGRGFHFIHGCVPFLVVVVTLFWFRLSVPSHFVHRTPLLVSSLPR